MVVVSFPKLEQRAEFTSKSKPVLVASTSKICAGVALLERHVPVVVAVDQQHGEAPVRDACDCAFLTVV